MAKKKNQNNNEENNGGGDGDGGKKQKASGVTVVLKIDLHCEGCAGKIVKAVRTLDGVESARIGDSELNKLTVIGNVDPVNLQQKVEEKTKKKVELISPAIKKLTQSNAGDDNNNKKKNNQQQQQKPVPGKKDEKKPISELPVTTAVLKVPLHCQGCVQRIRKLVSKTKGYIEMSLDKNKDLVTVKGAIDMKLLADALQHKLKRVVEIVPPKKDGGDGEKKGNGGGENEKKKKSGGGNDGGGKGGDDGEKKGGKGGGGGQGNDGGAGKIETHKMEGYGGLIGYPYPQYVYGSGYADYVHAPQLFSDENPNACIVM